MNKNIIGFHLLSGWHCLTKAMVCFYLMSSPWLWVCQKLII